MQNNRKSRSSARLLATLAMLLACAVVLTFIGTMLAKQNSAYNAPVIEGVSGQSSSSQSQTAASGSDGPQQLPLPASVHLDVPVIGQNPELPNGCEITSLTMLLQYLGFDVDKMTMAEDYLPRSEKFYGADPEVEFMGDPSQSSGESCGFYCFQGPIIQAAEKYLAAQGQADAWEVTDITGVDAAGLAEQLAAGNPVLVWATIDFKDVRESSKWSWTTASGETYTPLVDVHCLVLTGYEDNQFYLSDPLETYESVRQQKFMEIFTAMGSRAVVITPKEPAPEPTPDPSAEASSVPSSAA